MGLFKLSKKQLDRAAQKPIPLIGYPATSNTGSGVSDYIFNSIVERYRNLRNPWNKSDNLIWKSVCYTLPGFFGMILFFTIFWLLISFSTKKYGESRTMFWLIIVVLVRLNVLIKQLVLLNKKF
jgi:hypothetical protein